MMGGLELAIARHRAGDVDGARQAAAAAIKRHPHDVEVLHFLGMLEMAAGRGHAARHALEQAVAVKSGGLQLTSLARLLSTLDSAALATQSFEAPLGPAGEEYLRRRAVAREEHGDALGAASDLALLSDRRPDDIPLHLAAAHAAARADRMADAETLYGEILQRKPGDQQALLGLVGILESLGRGNELATLFSDVSDDRLRALGDMFAARDNGQFQLALAALDRATGLLPPATESQIRGDLADRAGDESLAMASFEQMNRADAATTPEWQEGVRRYRLMVAESLRLLDGPVCAAPPEECQAPIFLLGFPRSGTTLLDTFLMGHPDIEVHEERPFLDDASAFAGDPVAARRAYRNALVREWRDPNALQVDKYPLASARAPLIHAMFPQAKYLFALRDPRDVVLSCYMTRFRLNWGVSSFVTLDDAAVTYDRVMDLWVRSWAALGLDVHAVRYEELIADPATVLRRTASFADVPFDEVMLDHRSTARSRGLIPTPSHAQVVEPIYQRSAGRWRRYREYIDPLMPQLSRWCDYFGYGD